MKESVGPSPTSLSRSATTEGPSSSSFSRPKPKRHVVSTTTTTSMPRPLHLALGSVVGSSSSPSTPAASSPSPSPGLLPIHNGHNTTSSSSRDNTLFVEPGTLTPGTSRAPSPSPLSPTITSLKRHSTSSSSTSKRQSSISYIPANAHLDGFTRSPLSTTPLFFGDVGRDAGAGLTRSSSLGRASRTTPRSPAFPERTNQSSKEAQLTAPSHLKDRPPVTLAEKHAELLHFIAQKESKCLELRSQLAVHEAELLQLKRKWERIVNRGFERSQTLASTASSSTLPVSASLLSNSPSSAGLSPSNHSGPSSAVSASYFTGLAPAANAPGAVVLEGIKGGVQGMSRLIAAGLESIVHVNGPSTPSTPSSGQHNDIDLSPHAPHTSLRMDAAPASKHWARVNGSITRAHGHGQKESQSSSSTTTSAASSATFSSLSSTSTRTSATSAVSTHAESVSGSSSTSGDTTRKSASTTTPSSVAASVVSGSDIESEFGDFEDGRRGSMEPDPDQDQEQEVLMVYDTGATPTMSPNPHFQRRKKPSDNTHVEKLVLPPTTVSYSYAQTHGVEKDSDKDLEDFDWDDGWDEPISEAQAKDKDQGSLSSSVGSSIAASPISPRPAAPLSLAPPSAPGLGALNIGTPTPQQMSYWVGSVGKKWDELKGSTTFTKSQKRASLLLSDMQNSIVSALTSPPTATMPLFGANPSSTPPAPSASVLPASFSSNASHAKLSLGVAASVSTQPRPRSATSLLDDSDDENGAADASANHLRTKLSSRMMAPVMVPDSLSPSASSASAQSKQVMAGKAKTKVGHSSVSAKDDEDEWNW